VGVETAALVRAYLCDGCGARHDIPRAERAAMLAVGELRYRYHPPGWETLSPAALGREFVVCGLACATRVASELQAAAAQIDAVLDARYPARHRVDGGSPSERP
jgi:hypothetical protein